MSTDNESITVRAAGKVNLFLEPLGRRTDGYCDLRSVLAPVSVFDTLTLSLQPKNIETEMRLCGATGGEELEGLASERNLATRAAMALQRETGCTSGARIQVDKAIPVGGGLGGGSADAAATLIGLNQLWNAGLSGRRLMELGAELGCDVPALVHGGPVVMEGRGERVSPLEFDREQWADGIWLALANPGFAVSTRDVYRRLAALTSSGKEFNKVVSVMKRGEIAEMAAALFNGLQSVVFEKHPVIEMMAEAMAQAGSPGTLLSGSGATVLGLAWDRAHAEQLKSVLRERLAFPVWTGTACLLPDSVTVAHGPLEARV